MVRATIQLYGRAESACGAVDALRAVGLGDANIASLVLATDSSCRHPSSPPLVAKARSVRASIPGLGPCIITGWLVDDLPDGRQPSTEGWLRQLLKRAGASEKDIQMGVTTLQGGGGLVSVRSNDRIGSEPTVDDILKGRGA